MEKVKVNLLMDSLVDVEYDKAVIQFDCVCKVLNENNECVNCCFEYDSSEIDTSFKYDVLYDNYDLNTYKLMNHVYKQRLGTRDYLLEFHKKEFYDFELDNFNYLKDFSCNDILLDDFDFTLVSEYLFINDDVNKIECSNCKINSLLFGYILYNYIEDISFLVCRTKNYKYGSSPHVAIDFIYKGKNYIYDGVLGLVVPFSKYLDFCEVGIITNYDVFDIFNEVSDGADLPF